MLGEELRKARQAAGMTQEALAFEAELDRTYISHLEHDKYSPSVNALFRVYDALGIRASEFIARVEKERRTRGAKKRR